MAPRTAQQEATFLKYFFTTYIPPYTLSIPKDEEDFKDVYLSSADVWDNFGPALDTYTFSNQLKQELTNLFSLCDALWENYLCIPDNQFKTWVTSSEVQERWEVIKTQARIVYSLAKNQGLVNTTTTPLN